MQIHPGDCVITEPFAIWKTRMDRDCKYNQYNLLNLSIGFNTK